MRKLGAISILVAVFAVIVFIWRTAVRTPDLNGARGIPSPAAGQAWTPITKQVLSHGRFKQLTVYSPHATPRGVVLLLSGAKGWTEVMSGMAERIARQGAMVVGIDAPQLDASLEEDGAACVFPDGDLENLSHFVQAYYRLPTYLSPILAGYGDGATFSYAMLAQAPVNTFAGAVSMEFCPGYPMKKPLCKGSGVEFAPRARDGGVEFQPSPRIGNPWVVLQGAGRPTGDPQACDAGVVRNFVAQVPGATFVPVAGLAAPHTGSTVPPELEWPPEYAGAFDTLLARNAPAPSAAIPDALKDLPIVFVDAQPGAAPADTLGIMLSGDGGWAGIDKEVAAALSTAGIPVVGLDSLRYFWTARKPEGLAADLSRMIDYYATQLGKQRVMLIGYSQGADVLPFAVNRLTAAARSHVVLTAIIGMSEHALFEFHLSSWVSDDNSGPPTLPEVDRITGMTVLCIYGEDETDSLCPRLDPHKVTIVKLKGGHHFDGDYAALARTIMASTQAPTIRTAPRTSPSE
ncbi:MAG TPA: AcvB/VirJ family lysyl-phosphatidylglycerol hydrolase [Steroidobacteraceae bacterium]|nr:AcvB/VirJ family lysyl-phosphatidylglycerol hydrolase [Steroidobacteraceae bacterium]